MKKLIIAKNSGYCFGVRRAVKAVESRLGEGRVFTLGEIIHNKAAVEELRSRGAVPIESLDEAQSGDVVVIRSHGVGKDVYERAKERGIELQDATCPFVKRIHEIVKERREEGDEIVIAGHSAHPEVTGINGWCENAAHIVSTVEEAQGLPRFERVSVVAQTTFSPKLYSAISGEIQKMSKYVNIFQTICETTENRQREAQEIAQKSDVTIIIGGKHSSNTQKLAEICRAACKQSICIENTVELPIEKIASSDIIGIVVGASTPDWMIREVVSRMNELENTAAEMEQTEVGAVAVEAEAVTETVATGPDETIAAAPEAPAVSKDDGKDGEAVDSNIMEAYEKTMVRIRNGQVLQGSIVQITDDEVCVNIGYKSDGFIPKRELSSNPDFDPKAELSVGDPITVEVLKVNDGEGNVLLSRKSVENRKAWDEFLEAANTDKVYDAVGKEVVKSGVIAMISGIRAFIPASQLALKYVETEKMNEFVGKELRIKIIDIDKNKKRIVASRKAVLQLEAEEAKKEKWNALEQGSRIKGTVRRLTDFGAFVDIGGIDGLIHVTDMGWGRVKSPADILKIGEEVEVLILNVDPVKERVSLGYKQLQPKPWTRAAEKYIVGTVVEGRVVRIVPFGAFVSLEPTIDGLVHISQVATKRIAKVEDELKVGDIIKAKVLEVVPEAKRISLSRREVLIEEMQEQGGYEPEPEVYEAPAPQPQPQARPERQERTERAPREQREQREQRAPREQREPREHRERTREPREPKVDLPPIQKTTVSLADFFPKLDSLKMADEPEETTEE